MKKIQEFPLVRYFSQVQEEMHKVSWPTRQQTQQKTLVVISVSILVALYISGLDILFSWITKLLLS